MAFMTYSNKTFFCFLNETGVFFLYHCICTCIVWGTSQACCYIRDRPGQTDFISECCINSFIPTTDSNASQMLKKFKLPVLQESWNLQSKLSSRFIEKQKKVLYACIYLGTRSMRRNGDTSQEVVTPDRISFFLAGTAPLGHFWVQELLLSESFRVSSKHQAKYYCRLMLDVWYMCWSLEQWLGLYCRVSGDGSDQPFPDPDAETQSS